jgi:hypothetical protein
MRLDFTHFFVAAGISLLNTPELLRRFFFLAQLTAVIEGLDRH